MCPSYLSIIWEDYVKTGIKNFIGNENFFQKIYDPIKMDDIENLERWQDIKNYEGLYRVSDRGNIFSIKRNRLLKCNDHNNKYQQASLCKNGKIERFYVSRLVAEHFIENPLSLPEIDHVDRNKANNYFRNLRWCCRSDNLRNRNGWSRSGYKGVYQKRGRKFEARIIVNGKQKYLGSYDDPLEASKRYQSEAERICYPYISHVKKILDVEFD